MPLTALCLNLPTLAANGVFDALFHADSHLSMHATISCSTLSSSTLTMKGHGAFETGAGHGKQLLAGMTTVCAEQHTAR